MYEQLLNDLRGAGNAGEFYTPRAITQFMADRLNPSLAKREAVMDPACGTGGFLTAAIDHLRNQLTAKSRAADKAAIEGLIRGIEKKQLPHLLCTTNMLLHGIDVPSQIEHRNTLGVGWNEWSANDKVDCVITNPPFGGYEDDGVGGDYPADLRTRESDSYTPPVSQYSALPSVSEIRREAQLDAKKAVAAGRSPALEKQREKRRLTAAKNFGDVALKWLADAKMTDSTRAMRKHVVDRDILPVFKSRLLNEITADDLRAL